MVGFDQAMVFGADLVLQMNPIYLQEVRTIISGLGMTVDVIAMSPTAVLGRAAGTRP